MRPREAALYYAPDGYEVENRNVMGRHVAGSTFLEALVRHREGPLYGFTPDRKHFLGYRKQVRSFLGAGRAQVVWVSGDDHSSLERLGSLFVPGPGIGEFAWTRRLLGDHRYSLCGVFHTTATHRVMDALGELIVAPTQEWDAVVCTSRAVKESILGVLDRFRDYHFERFGERPRVRPQLPVIPLGVHVHAFEGERVKRQVLRDETRRQLGIEPHEIVVLFVGRLSHTAKVHPVPTYLALEAARRATGKEIRLVQCGWFSHPELEKEYQAEAQRLAPGLRTTFVDGRDSHWKERIWYAGDIFTSLSDNVQETFGLTPLEAMAAGLPVVVSDWDGYRDTVRHGVDGFRIPTTQSPPGTGAGLALDHARGRSPYGLYVGLAAQMAAVDIRSTREAFIRLFMDSGLRIRMGAAGRGHVEKHFDWRVVLDQYRGLWSELAERRARCASGGNPSRTTGHPGRMDPFHIFACYPTVVLAGEVRLKTGPTGDTWSVEDLLRSPLIEFVRPHVEAPEVCDYILEFVRRERVVTPSGIAKIVPRVPGARLMATLGWLIKYGFLELEAPPRPR